MRKIIGILMMTLLFLSLTGIGTNAGIFGIPDDPDFFMQWYLNNEGQTYGTPDADIDAPEAWDIETGNSEIVVAIIDTGVDYNHPDLINNIWINEDEIPDNGVDDDGNGYIDDVRGWNFYDNNSDQKDIDGHGTMCAGIVAAVGNNSIGISGVTWNCKIMALRETDDTPSALDSWDAVIKAVEYAVDNGANIISLSIGDYDIQNLIGDVINYAYERGVFICAAAGNDNRNIKLYPAAFENVTAVAATDHNDEKVWFSTYGEWIDIAAPGINIYSTMPTYHVFMNDPPFSYTETYSYGAGTSFSAPQVAGVAALLLSINPFLTPDELKVFLCDNVDPYISTVYIGMGRLNAYKSLEAVLQYQLPPNTPTVDGEINGEVNTYYDYTIQSTDPEQHDIKYYVDWGDGNSNSTDLVESGKQIILKHMWIGEGNYSINVKAYDKYGKESDWGTLEVSMPKSIDISNPWLFRLIQRFPILEFLI